MTENNRHDLIVTMAVASAIRSRTSGDQTATTVCPASSFDGQRGSSASSDILLEFTRAMNPRVVQNTKAHDDGRKCSIEASRSAAILPFDAQASVVAGRIGGTRRCNLWRDHFPVLAARGTVTRSHVDLQTHSIRGQSSRISRAECVRRLPR